MKRYVYKIQNQLNKKVYIGQTKNPNTRKANHFYLARKGDERHLYASIRKYGQENFVFEVIEECNDDSINEREEFWVSHYDSFNHFKGYNLTRGGEGTKGCDKPKSPEHRQKMSEAAKRFWDTSPNADKRRQQLIEKNKSDERRRVASDAQHRRWSDPKQRQEMSKRHKGKIVSTETRKKISESLKGKPGTFTGRKHSEETRKKISEAAKMRVSISCSRCGKTFKVLTNTHKRKCSSE